MHCRTAEKAIIAARAGEIAPRQQRALDRHLADCGSCAAERVAIERVLRGVDSLGFTGVVPARVEQEVLRRVRALEEEEAAAAESWRRRLSTWVLGLTPAMAATAVVVVALIGVEVSTQQAPSPAAMRRPTVGRVAKRQVPEQPPPELASRPDLFIDLPILRAMDKLRHYDAIATMEDDDPAAPTGDPSPSDG